MRTLIKRVVDLDKEPELSELKPLDRVKTAIRFKYRQSAIYRNKLEKTQNELLRQRMKDIEDLKTLLLHLIQKDLVNNKNVKSVRLLVPRYFKDVLDETLQSVDFLAFDIKVIKENKDFLLAFPDMKILLEVKLKIE